MVNAGEEKVKRLRIDSNDVTFKVWTLYIFSTILHVTSFDDHVRMV